MSLLKRGLDLVYHNRISARVLHTLVHCLQRELAGCSTVLDLGCGSSSPLQFCGISWSVGVDGHIPSLEASRGRGLHDAYVAADVRYLEFRPGSFDAVLLVDVIEHLGREDGEDLLLRAESWARKRVVVKSPNGFFEQATLGDNPYQVHKSGWTVADMTGRDYRAFGMAGWKGVRSDRDAGAEDDEQSLCRTIRWRPRPFWLMFSALSQVITYYVPEQSFEVLYVKDLALDSHPAT